MHSCPSVNSFPSLYLNVQLNMDCHFIFRSAEYFLVYLKQNKSKLRNTLGQNVSDDLRKDVFERDFFTLFQHPAFYEDHDLCPTSFDADIGEPVRMCSPFQGFPPPQVSWELPDGTMFETGGAILHVTIKSKNDFGRYRCIARSLEKNVYKANITIRERSKY